MRTTGQNSDSQFWLHIKLSWAVSSFSEDGGNLSFIYLFLAVAGSLLLHRLFSSCGE